MIAFASRALPIRRRGRLAATGTLGAVSAVVVALAVVIAVFGPLIAPYDPNRLNLTYSFAGPTGGHVLGFDLDGRDILSRLLVGARSSMIGPVVVVGLAMAVGTLLAVAAAWKGGFTDTVIAAVVDILFAFPGILLAVLTAAVFGPSLTAAALALAVAYTPYIARILRGAFARERGQQYVQALEVQGVSATAICLRHLVPNVLQLMVAQGTILFGYAMLDLAAISFLGLGVQPPQADWGVMVAEGETGVLQGYPTESLVAGVAIVVVVVGFNILGERLAERGPAR